MKDINLYDELDKRNFYHKIPFITHLRKDLIPNTKVILINTCYQVSKKDKVEDKENCFFAIKISWVNIDPIQRIEKLFWNVQNALNFIDTLN